MDFGKMKDDLMKSGKADKVMHVADSEEGRRLMAKLDEKAVTKAANSGDPKAIQDILRQVLSTEEGRRLAEKLNEAIK